ncbi:hypothetical protein N879_05775 [Alcaligenes sp. EGD-AK7]|nr:hypothetical protein C660_09677 [Alcaligenes sp. HPC1271]ERI35029.1 hypothetical protein N879_05775 [Alcaligenes sp. EGD-AK7]
MTHPVSSNTTALFSTQPSDDALLNRARPTVQPSSVEVRLHNNGSTPPLAQVGMTSTLDESLENLNASMEAWATGMRFDMDEDAQRLVVSIIDSNTGEVLRTVPSEAVIQVARMIVQLQGTMINTQA